MSADFEIPSRTITVGKGGSGGSFTVRGVNADDVVFITTTYLEDLKKILGKYKVEGRVPKSRVADLVLDVIRDFPMMSSEIISRCADVPDQSAKFRNLGFIKQVEALKAIVELSTEDDQGELLKKAGAGLASLLEANGLVLGPLAKQLQTIIGTSESLSPISG